MAAASAFDHRAFPTAGGPWPGRRLAVDKGHAASRHLLLQAGCWWRDGCGCEWPHVAARLTGHSNSHPRPARAKHRRRHSGSNHCLAHSAWPIPFIPSSSHPPHHNAPATPTRRERGPFLGLCPCFHLDRRPVRPSIVSLCLLPFILHRLFACLHVYIYSHIDHGAAMHTTRRTSTAPKQPISSSTAP